MKKVTVRRLSLINAFAALANPFGSSSIAKIEDTPEPELLSSKIKMSAPQDSMREAWVRIGNSLKVTTNKLLETGNSQTADDTHEQS